MHLLALERIGAREGRLRPARVPVMAVSHQEGVEALAAAVAKSQLPSSVAEALGVLNWRFEADPVTDAKVINVIIEVGGDLGVVWIIGVILRHRIIGVGHPQPRSVDVEVAVAGRHPIDVLVDPVAANAV